MAQDLPRGITVPWSKTVSRNRGFDTTVWYLPYSAPHEAQTLGEEK